MIKNVLNKFSRVVILGLVIPYFVNAADSNSNSSMVKDGLGNTYAAWIDGSRDLQVAVTPTDNREWKQWLIASNVSSLCIATSYSGLTVISWVSPDLETLNDTLYTAFFISNSWSSAFRVSDTKDQIYGSYSLEVNDNKNVNIIWDSSEGVLSASALFEENPSFTIISLSRG